VLLERVAERYARRAAAAGRVVAVAETNGIRLAVDPTRIEAAVGNLVDNALVHGSGKVELSAQVHGGFVHLTVHDEGAGFPPGFAPHAFDRFSRADEARGRPGSGLGLSIVDLVARAHGGAAHVANRSGSGTVVWIELPNAQEIHSRMRAGS
jgi:signal transduction histidine kinase